MCMKVHVYLYVYICMQNNLSAFGIVDSYIYIHIYICIYIYTPTQFACVLLNSSRFDSRSEVKRSGKLKRSQKRSEVKRKRSEAK